MGEDQQMTENVVLAELADSLIADLANHRSGKTAKTVMSGSVMRAVVIALAEGADMSEHDSPTAATLYAITGELTLSTSTNEWRIHPGELLTLPRQRHSVHAHRDSAFLLTVALR
jgi:quercetin dioxygenase-like cupin family protein